MKPPYFNVLGRRIYINYKEMEEDLHGEYRSKDGIIDIDHSLEGKDLLGTLIHELIHATLDRIGADDVLNDGVEEIICQNLESVLIENNLIIEIEEAEE